MITSYHRPTTLRDALALLAQPDTVPLGGGTLINTPRFDKSPGISVVDLQALGLDLISTSGQNLELGASVTLQQLLQSGQIHAALKQALKQEAPANVRNMATIAGTLVAADGRSTFATVMLALDARLTVVSQQTSIVTSLGDTLPLRGKLLNARLITKVSIPLNVDLAYSNVARTPADKPIVSAALARWPGGRLRLALGGFGNAPLLGLDATDPGGLAAAARNAFHDASDDRASADYRMDIAAILANRCLEEIQGLLS
jgi:CO/xanthine dehydrogenase FAD-binding subunit